MRINVTWLAGVVVSCQLATAQTPLLREAVRARVNEAYPSLFELYQDLHRHPELAFHEEQSAARVARELRQTGCEVTTGVGGHGVVAVLRNGSSPVILVRSDMDALPVKEQTGLPYASAAVTQEADGKEVPVMHACGHDAHMTSLVGAARVLASLKDQWQGTVVFIGQPAEEVGAGARRMLADGLFTRFPRPDYCLALHVSADLPAGSLGYVEGFALANIDTVEITVRGVGGHGAFPQTTKDPVVLAAQTVLALQTIVSRELTPGDPAVVTVGSIHGGTKSNIIPDEVRLQLTLRSYTVEARRQILESIQRITRGLALAAGVPEDRQPMVRVAEDPTRATYNHPALTRRLAGVWQSWLGADQVVSKKPVMGGEDFGEYGLTEHQIPICMFWVGAVKPETVKACAQAGKPLPSLHSPLFAPLPEPTLKTAITAMSAATLELLGSGQARRE